MLQNTLVPAIWLFLAAIASAAPISDEPITTAGNNIGYGTGGGIAGLIILILDIIVISSSPPIVFFTSTPLQRHVSEHPDTNPVRQNSRSIAIQPASLSQGPLDPCHPPFPSCRHDPLLPLLQPRSS